MKQRDNHWRQARLGCVTASRFGDLLTNPSVKGVFSVEGERGAWHVMHEGKVITGDFTRQTDAKEIAAEKMAEWRKTHWSATAVHYMRELRAERLRGEPFDRVDTKATRWGSEWEAIAFEHAMPVIEERLGQTLALPVDDFAFIPHYCEPRIGCSPDGIIGDDGLWEGKCPYDPIVHDTTVDMGVMPKEHIPQVQGSLWCTKRKFYIFTSFDPRLRGTGVDPLFLLRVERDNDYIDNILAPRVVAFRDYLQAEYTKLRGEGEPF